MGRLTRDPDVRYSQGEKATVVARFPIAVDRRYRRDGESNADFINCVAFGKIGEIIEKYGHKGTKFVVEGRIQTGSYTNKEGQRVYTTDVVVENIDFAESKNAGSGQEGGCRAENSRPESASVGDGFMNIPDGIDEGLPFN